MESLRDKSLRDTIGDTLVIASHNAGKISEIATLLAPFGITATSAADYGLIEPEETEDNFIGNARIKAHFAAKETGLPALADDSGICIDALDGAPGVYTADWAETPNGRDFVVAMEKTYHKLEAINAAHPRSCAFWCTLCLAWPDGRDMIFEGRVFGRFSWPMRGDLGFGYDPIFIPDGFDETFGQMNPAQKHKMSHRAVAFEKLRDFLT